MLRNGRCTSHAEHDNKTTFDAEARLEIYKHVVLRDGGPRSEFLDYRLMGDAQP
jgi:hypothetical protein